jgi:succinoglycan biosynthesis transport protein ExoP
MALMPNKSTELAQYVLDVSAIHQMVPAGGAISQQPSFLSRMAILGRHWWKIASFVVLAVVVTAVVSRRLGPMYESTALIDADRQAYAGVVGEDAGRSFSESDTDEFLATQMKLIQSDAVLRPVVEKYNLLLVEHQPVRRVASGEAPIELKRLKVIRAPRTRLLYITYSASDPRLAADVANAIANSYIMHSYQTRVRAATQLSQFMETQLDELKHKMELSKKRQAEFARELDVVDPEQKTSVLAARLMELNTEYTKAQADRVAKQASFQSMKQKSLAAIQLSSQGESLRALADKVNSLRSIFASTKAVYGTNHPQYRRAWEDLEEGIRQYDEAKKEVSQQIDVDYQQALERENMIRASVATTKADLDKLTSHSLDYQQLKHEADADTKLYEELVRRIREAGLNSSFQGNAIRMADVARPAIEPVWPRPILNTVIAFLASLILAVGAVFASEMLYARVHGPAQVQQDLNARLIATLPEVRHLPVNHNLSIEGRGGLSLLRYVTGKPMIEELAAYTESIRQLRNSILLSRAADPIRSILVTSSLAGEGKSTTALHLSISCANQGKRTLLIDADLRHPTLHSRLGLNNGSGLAEVLTGTVSGRNAIVPVPNVPNLYTLRAGEANDRASDLMGPAISSILRDASQEYDLVVIDAPPLLAFAETLQLATAVDGVSIVTRAGSTSTKSVSAVLSTLDSINAPFIGVVLNRFRDSSRSRYYARYARSSALRTGLSA